MSVTTSPPSRGPLPSWLLPLLAVLFLASGFSALMYQVLWTRLLSLVFGVTVHAASAVLASYMGGLALGSLLAGRVGDRAKSPLTWFGLVEIGIGVTAFASPHALDLLQRIYVGLYPALSDSPALLAVGRFVCASAILLVPTMLMGATLPLVVKSSLAGMEGLGTRLSLLYATNTTGAILGAVTAGFYLVANVGIRTSFSVAAAINVAVGLCAVLAARRLAGASRPGATAAGSEALHDAVAPDASSESTVLTPSPRRAVLIVFALSGFVSLALEVVWFRVLVLFLGPTTYAFTVMLAAVLAGIALGSYAIAPLMRRRWDWLAVLAAIEFALAAAALLSFFALTRAYALVDVVAGWLGVDPRNHFAVSIVLSFASIVPATLLMGIGFPIGLRLWASGDAGGQQVARHIGVFYSLNVCGAIVGSLGAGFVLLPALGSRGSLLLLAGLVAFGAALLGWHVAPARRRAAVLSGGTIACALAALTVPDPFVFSLERLHRGERELWREEGVQTTVSVHERGRGRDQHRVMYLDGRHQANDTRNTLFVHRRIGLLPMALHPDPKQALVIGLGGGATPGGVAMFPRTQVTVVELSRTVVNGAEWFRHANYDLLRRPNVTLRIDDGRNYLMLTPRQYDVITADIMLPVHAGATSLYSAEYFRLVQQALDYNGIVLQWIGSSSEAEYKLILRTFMSVFRNTTLWADGSLLVGTRHPLVIERAAFDRKLADPATAEALAAMGLHHFDRLLQLFVAGPEQLRAFAGPGPILTDDRPTVEYFLTLPREPEVDLSGLRGDVMQYVR